MVAMTKNGKLSYQNPAPRNVLSGPENAFTRALKMNTKTGETPRNPFEYSRMEDGAQGLVNLIFAPQRGSKKKPAEDKLG